MKFARCPECGRNVTMSTPAVVFPPHITEVAPAGPSMECPGTGWLVEDDDLIGGRWPR